MFGVELDTIKKIEIGFCIAILAVAGILIWKAAKGTKDDTVQGYSDAEVIVAQDNRYPVSATNPVDPNRTYRNTWFINSDGRLQFKEYTRKINSDLRAEMHFYPDQTKKIYDCFPTVRQTIAAISEVDKRAVAEAIVQFITVTKNNNERATFSNSTFMRELGLPQADLNKLNTDCEQLIKRIKLIDDDVALGSLETKKYEQVMAALQAFRNCGPGDIASDPRKAAAAKKVMSTGLEYIKLVQDKKLKEITDFTDSILGTLSADQKAKIVAIASPKPRPTAGGNTGRNPGNTGARPGGRRPATAPGV
jgi:hypothetical protein